MMLKEYIVAAGLGDYNAIPITTCVQLLYCFLTALGIHQLSATKRKILAIVETLLQCFGFMKLRFFIKDAICP